MEKIDINGASLESVVSKVNEIVDFINQSAEEKIAELKKERNLITYGKYMTDEEVLSDMKSQLRLYEMEKGNF